MFISRYSYYDFLRFDKLYNAQSNPVYFPTKSQKLKNKKNKK